MSDSPGPEQGKEELESLNADELDVQELDDALLEEAAGGTFYQDDSMRAGCGGFSCTNNVC
jgi:hypothetical protein